MTEKQAAGFENVLEEELDVLDQLRRAGVSKAGDSVYRRARESNLVGLAFSGGGIRSATFNLGVIQALSRYRLLSKFDYLSTVSGGGYIGGWLSALLHREAKRDGKVDQQAVEDFELRLMPHPTDSGLGETVGFKPVEHKAVRYLRCYSNYLSPRLGLSGDALAVASIFLRNFVLIQMVLIGLVASVLLLACVVGATSTAIAHEEWSFEGAVLTLMFAIFSAGRLAAERGIHPEKPSRAARSVVLGVVLPCALAAWWFCAAIVAPAGAWHQGAHSAASRPFWWWMLAGAVVYGAAWALGYVAACSKHRRRGKKENGEAADAASGFTHFIVAILAGAMLGLLMYAAVKQTFDALSIDIWHAVAFGPPLFLLGLSFVVTVHIGAAGHAFTENDREWFARLGGFVLACAAAWSLIFVLVLYATPLVQWLAGGGLVALATWAAGSGFGARLGYGPATGDTARGSRWKEIAAQIAPWLFVAGLAVIVAYVTHIALLEFLTEQGYAPPSDTGFGAAARHTLQQLNELPARETFYALVVVFSAFALLAWRFDINLFSLHALYCQRLTRAYLGASRAAKRQPNPFTGFDAADDLPCHELKRQRPIPIVNTAINMTGGDDLAWQTRRAASFAYTPCWAGFETRSTQGKPLGVYRPTGEYSGGQSLGVAMAISGAAASPNMGYHTSAAVATLMTSFNLRLGRWCGNPARDRLWKKSCPGFAAQPILAELTGSATAQAGWINLTDGGHFDNLGVYELIRRRCRLIVVTDAGCDPQHQFEDLANLLRKCWTDLGVNIRFDDFEPMRLRQNSRYCAVHGVVGSIQYDKDGPDGVLLYLKSSLTGNEWPDIRQYADSHKDFPHETTTDQFFDENQFEAYRHLGYKVVANMIQTLQALLARKP